MALSKETLSQKLAEHLDKAMRDNHCQASAVGLWQIIGEVKDPSMFSRDPHGPQLGFVTGTLLDVVAWAIQQPAFFEWGAGGEIHRVTPIDVAGQAVTLSLAKTA